MLIAVIVLVSLYNFRGTHSLRSGRKNSRTSVVSRSGASSAHNLVPVLRALADRLRRAGDAS